MRGFSKLILRCLVVVFLAASVSWATGPDQQRLPWRPTLVDGKYENVNSVVQLRFIEGTDEFFGSGSVVCGRHDNATNTDWLGVLTADHNVKDATDKSVWFGDNGAIAKFGGAHTHGAGSTTKPAWSLQVGSLDVAVLAVQINADPLNGDTRAQFASRIKPLSMISDLYDPRDILTEKFTQMGYGKTGSFTGAGMDTVPRDNRKRFQNNVFEEYIPTASDDGYTEDLLRYAFNVAPATGFLAAEGLGYGGDSGGPALYNHLTTQYVPMITRPAPGENWVGGDMELLDNVIAGVFVSGNWNDATGGSSPYNASRGNFVPITPERRALIGNICSTIPEPGSLSLLLVGAFPLLRRPRAARGGTAAN